MQGYQSLELSGKDDSTKAKGKPPVSSPKGMAMQGLSDRECKIRVLEFHRQLRENTDKRYNEIRETTKDQNESSTKKLKIRTQQKFGG